MATYSFTRLSSGTVKVVADGNTYFIPGDCKVNPNDSLNRIIITDRYGAKITMDSEVDTINIAGIANTGTATEIAEDLATDIFFLASSGGAAGAAMLAEANVFTEVQTVQKNAAAGTVAIYSINTNTSGWAEIDVYADNGDVGMWMVAYGSTHATNANKSILESWAPADFQIKGAADIHYYPSGAVAPVVTMDAAGIKADKFSVSDLNAAPANAADTGTKGDIRVTATHIYVCTATDTWKRVAISTW